MRSQEQRTPIRICFCAPGTEFMIKYLEVLETEMRLKRPLSAINRFMITEGQPNVYIVGKVRYEMTDGRDNDEQTQRDNTTPVTERVTIFLKTS